MQIGYSNVPLLPSQQLAMAVQVEVFFNLDVGVFENIDKLFYLVISAIVNTAQPCLGINKIISVFGHLHGCLTSRYKSSEHWFW